jgi:predicted ribosome quality control (RQC) complex YloA/Tae2 family protein
LIKVQNGHARFGLFVCEHKLETVNNATLEAVIGEIKPIVDGRRFGRVFPLSSRSFAVDLRLPDSRYLLVSAAGGDSALYLIKRRLKDLERSSGHMHAFHLLLKKHLSDAEVRDVAKSTNDRIVRFEFLAQNDLGETVSSSMVAQLTGKSANVFLLDDRSRIIGSLVEKDIEGQRLGEEYSPPPRSASAASVSEKLDVEIRPEDNGSVSAAVDRTRTAKERHDKFLSRAASARREVDREIAKRRKLLSRLRADLDGHGDADVWRRYGDLLLANLATAERRGNRVTVVDYFDEATPKTEIPVDENISLTDAAADYFKRYTKAQNAKSEIGRRVAVIAAEIVELEEKLELINAAIGAGDESFFPEREDRATAKQKEKKEKERFAGTRRFTSSDGFEILVGKRAVDNDHLTFRIAASLDTWLHAADYPGSHVVIRNPDRKEIPQRTLFEAASLAAFYSSGKTQPKAAVHYTQKKFVNKPKGAAPGLVRLASFKTILVEPAIPTALDQKHNA